MTESSDERLIHWQDHIAQEERAGNLSMQHLAYFYGVKVSWMTVEQKRAVCAQILFTRELAIGTGKVT